MLPGGSHMGDSGLLGEVMMRSFLGMIVFAGIVSILNASTAKAIVVFDNRDDFVNAAGAGLQFEGFDDIPTNADGEGAFSDGDLFGDGAFSLDALHLATDIKLTESWLIGTFLVRTSSNPEINLWPGPGGIGNTSSLKDHDDFRITFNQPLRAFGILIVENHIEAGESITFYDVNGNPTFQAPLPGNHSGIGGDGFIGYIAESPDEYILSVEVDEGQTLNDDIGFDWVYFDPVPEPGTVGLFGVLGMVLMRRRRSA